MSRTSQEYQDSMDDGDYAYDLWKDRQLENDPAYMEWSQTIEQQNQQHQDEAQDE